MDRDTITYAIVTPARDEAQYLQATIDSVVAQTVRPTEWIIVDDGSTDDTPSIVERAAAAHDWIRLVRMPDRGERVVGAGVIEAFNAGLATIGSPTPAFLCKLDADLVLLPTYFARLLQYFMAEPRLGIASGRITERVGLRVVYLRHEPEMVFGAAKFYRRACFDEIGGLEPSLGWDGIDCYQAMRHNWWTGTLPDPALEILHLRRMGTSHKSILHGCARRGRGLRYNGAHPIWVLASATYHMLDRPYILAGAAVLIGYLGATLRGEPRMSDKEFIAYLRQWQMQKLRGALLGRSRRPPARDRGPIHGSANVTGASGVAPDLPEQGLPSPLTGSATSIAEAEEHAPFSVVMSTYVQERAEFLETSLSSIVRQTRPAAEIVMVVDGPIDMSQERVIKRWSDEAARRGTRFVRVNRDTSSGITAALNDGIAASSQPWLARMDSDDYSPPYRFETQWRFVQTHPEVDLVAGAQLEFTDNPFRVDRAKAIPETHEAMVRVLRWRNTISHPSVVMRSRLVREVGGYREVPLLEDYDLFLRLVAAGARCYGLQQPMIHTRTTDAQRRRRGGLSVARSEARFRMSLFRRGDISLLNLLISVPVFFAFRICPTVLKRAAYALVRRNPRDVGVRATADPPGGTG
jgi:glycosyltransferase involved in cell wall biosynthesis